jgi:general secretion pathway protein H
MTTPTLAADRPRRAGRPWPAQQGFTLLELMVVLALLVLGVGLVIPNLANRGGSEFNAEVRQAVAMLRYARRVAIVEAQPRAVRFYALDRRAADYAVRRQALQSARQPTDWISESIALAYGDDLSQPTRDERALTLTFFPQGGSTGGVLTFTQGERRARLRVDPITGRIAVAYAGEELDREALDAAF